MLAGYSAKPVGSPAVTEGEVLSLAAMFMFLIASRPAVPALGLYAAIGIVLLIATELSSREALPFRDGRSGRWIPFLAVAAIAFVAIPDPYAAIGPDGVEVIVLWYAAVAVWLATAAFLTLTRRARISGAATVLLVSLVLGISLIQLTKSHQIDVYWLHSRAAEHLAEGISPYAELGVPNGSPTAAPDDVIDGYPYPPLTLILYALGTWAGDPRYTSLVAWLAVLGGIAILAAHKWPAGEGITLLLVLAAQPGWLYVLRNSWTEPVTAMFVTLALATWRRWPGFSSVLLGLAIASKQYMILALPVLVFGRYDRKPTRILIAFATVVATTAPFLSHDLWNSTVLFLLDAPPRVESGNLIGLLDLAGTAWQPSVVVSVGLPVVVSMYLTRRFDDGSPATFGLLLATVLAISFFLGSQAFANYWFIAGVVAAGGLASVRGMPAVEPRAHSRRALDRERRD